MRPSGHIQCLSGTVRNARASAAFLRAVFITICVLFVIGGFGPPPASSRAEAGEKRCRPTPPDSLGPFYKPGAPQREKVGSGYRLGGVVRSAETCLPIPGARIEFWMAGPDGEYDDAYRATVYARENGGYRFQSHYPPGYYGRPPHIHVRVAAEGFETLTTQHYPSPGAVQADFDFVLQPQP